MGTRKPKVEAKVEAVDYSNVENIPTFETVTEYTDAAKNGVLDSVLCTRSTKVRHVFGKDKLAGITVSDICAITWPKPREAGKAVELVVAPMLGNDLSDADKSTLTAWFTEHADAVSGTHVAVMKNGDVHLVASCDMNGKERRNVRKPRVTSRQGLA